jgi:hypothetical protein
MGRAAYAWIGFGMVVAACATASLPPARTLEPGDLKVLAGRWEGVGTTVHQQRFTFSWVVREDGSVTTASEGGSPTAGCRFVAARSSWKGRAPTPS